MSHGGKVDHKSGRSKVINCGARSLCARGLYNTFKLGDRQLSVRLTQRDQANSGGDQIRDVALKEGWQRQGERSAFACKPNSENNGQGRRNLSLAKYLR